jgi:hypothetical protein
MGRYRIPAAEMAEVVITQRRAVRIVRLGKVTTRMEKMAAETTDGRWRLARDESPGTPWLVISLDTPAQVLVDQRGTLEAARWYVKAGHADAMLARLRDHEAGAHAGERDAWCTKC